MQITILALLLFAGASSACENHVQLARIQDECMLEDSENSKGKPFRIGEYTWKSFQAFTESGARCSTKTPSQEEIEADRNSLEQFKKSRDPNQTRLLQVTTTIPVYWHKIIGAGGVGVVSDTQIADSILVLNNAYAPAGYAFNLVQIDETTNDAWYNVAQDTTEESDMKAALHQGTMATLNVYSANPGGGLLGWATFPMSNVGNQDGVVFGSIRSRAEQVRRSTKVTLLPTRSVPTVRSCDDTLEHDHFAPH